MRNVRTCKGEGAFPILPVFGRLLHDATQVGLHAQVLPANAGQHRDDCGNALAALATTDQEPVRARTATRLGSRSSPLLSIGRRPSLNNRVRDFPFDNCPRRLLDCLPGRRRLGRRCRSAWNRTRGGSGDCRGTRDTMRRATLPGKECSPGNVPPQAIAITPATSQRGLRVRKRTHASGAELTAVSRRSIASIRRFARR